MRRAARRDAVAVVGVACARFVLGFSVVEFLRDKEAAFVF